MAKAAFLLTCKSLDITTLCIDVVRRTCKVQILNVELSTL